MSSLSEVARLDDPTFYADDSRYQVYTRLRHEAPVYWYEPGQFWALSKYEDIRSVTSRCPQFTSRLGANITGIRGSDPTAGLLPPGTEVITLVDPPRHDMLRRLVSKALTPKRMAGLEPWARQLVRSMVDRTPVGEPFDLVEALSVPLPVIVIAQLLGVPQTDWDRFKGWGDAFVEGIGNLQDPETFGRIAESLLEGWAYLHHMLELRRADPQDDLMTALSNAEVDGERLSEENIVMLCNTLVFGGNETTRNLISASVHRLAENPDQRAKLDDRSLLPGAVEELLRWTCPIVGMGRTVTEEATVGGQVIPEGDYVVMLFQSACRDEDIFPDPDVLDVTRVADHPQLAFGFGVHTCVGASLARMELRVVLDELLSRFPSIELAEEPVYSPTTFIQDLKHLSVILQP